MCATCPAHSILLDLNNQIICAKEYKQITAYTVQKSLEKEKLCKGVLRTAHYKPHLITTVKLGILKHKENQKLEVLQTPDLRTLLCINYIRPAQKSLYQRQTEKLQI
jgi:hypothetical protein